MAMADLIERIKNQLDYLNMNRNQLATKCNGISRSYIYKILDGQVAQAVKPAKLKILATALKISYLELHDTLYGDSVTMIQKRKSRSKALIQGDDSAFIADVTYADNELVYINQVFEKIWEIRNAGKVVWENRFLKRDDSQEGLGALICETDKISLAETKPGEIVKIKIKFKAPAFPGTTISYWKMINEKGEYVFPELKGIWCRVIVIE